MAGHTIYIHAINTTGAVSPAVVPLHGASADCSLLLQGASAAALAPAQACLQGYQEVHGSQEQ
jgi:hypothetical protein